MRILRYSAHQRYAVGRKASIHREGRRIGSGLLVELSQEGCRIGCLSDAGQNNVVALAIDDLVTIKVDGAAPIEARVRWTGGGTLGMKLLRALHRAELDLLVRTCRGEFDEPELREYGT
ncbi:PilZ domain-containing protein [Novosphingobium sp. BL-8H]|uniref:PilZ domain-containing protein n=1 Tax=Novosphingobium sp. BL-8H TaxID=3127640 RepID=UPI003757DCD6